MSITKHCPSMRECFEKVRITKNLDRTNKDIADEVESLIGRYN